MSIVINDKQISNELTEIHTLIVETAVKMVGYAPTKTPSSARLVPQPTEELNVLYRGLFGPSLTEVYFAMQDTKVLVDTDMMASLISFWILSNVLDSPTPWRRNFDTRTGSTSLWPSFVALLEQKGVNAQETVNQAALEVLKDEKFKTNELSQRVAGLRDKLSLTLWPQIALLREFNSGGHNVDAWRMLLSEILQRSLVLRAKLEAIQGMTFNWLWYNGSELMDFERMQLIYPRSEGVRVGITISPGLSVARQGSEPRIVQRAQVWTYGSLPVEPEHS